MYTVSSVYLTENLFLYA